MSHMLQTHPTVIAPAPPTAIEGATIRIVIADDQPVAASGAALALAARGIEICATIHDARCLVDAYAYHRPDVVVIETAMGATDSVWPELSTLFREHPAAAVLVLTCQLSAESVNAALDVGCAGVIPKTSTIDVLEETVREVARGQHQPHPRALAVLLADMHVNDLRRSRTTLTERELSVLILVADGLGNIEIADRLGIGESTVKSHVGSALRKLNAHDRAHAVGTALRLGIIS
jgi:DNA-binding NarL/FixJ family response regulator